MYWGALSHVQSVLALGVQAKEKLWGLVQWEWLCASPVAVTPWKNNFSCLQACAVISQAI